MIRILIFLFILPVFAVMAQSEDDAVILTINKEQISKGEFERIYRKNNTNLFNESDKKTPQEYMELFINFKLKVLEAQRMKLDTSTAFIEELKGYRQELAAPYLTDVKYNEELVRELYNRTTKEINASHILFRLDSNAPEEQVQEVLNKTKRLREEILNGKDFNAMARQHSEDPSARSNQGNLGYFSAFQMVAPFENMAFTTPVGEVSEPVRSRFGYHLIKVHDIRDHQGEIRVAHIMKTFPRDASESIKRNLKQEIDNIYNQLQNGTDFGELARAHSDDKNSSVKGGEMPWFAASRMIPEFTGPAFALQNDGDYTEPVETPYGYHIIKRLERRPVPSFDEAKQGIEANIKRDPERSNSSKKAFIEKLKQEYSFRLNKEAVQKLKETEVAQLTGLTSGDNDTIYNEIFTLNGKSFGKEELRSYLEEKKVTTGNCSTHLDPWIDAEITAYEDARLEQKYPEFRYLMQEYHDGILLFAVSEKMIWNKAVEDSTGLEEFYKNLRKKHLWEERFKGMIITCTDRETREEAEKYFAAGMSSDEIIDLIRGEAENNRITIKTGAWEKGMEPIVDYFVWNGIEPDDFNSETTFIRGDKVLPEPKELDEARGLYISDYQNHLEKIWLKKLRKQYKISVKRKILKTIEGV